MNIIFFGSSKFAVPALKEILAKGHKVACVVTQPDRRKGRGLHMEATEIKKAAHDVGLKVYQPQQINTNEAVNLLKGFKPDLFVVIAYGQILSEDILSIPKLFSINAHASLLPKYRGAAPISYSIINGEHQTGVTIIKITKDMDAGPIMMQKAVPIGVNDTIVTLEEKLALLAGELTVEALELIGRNKYALKQQDAKQVSFSPKLKKEDGLIDWNEPAADIHNLIKGCFNWPGAFTYYKGKLLKIYSAEVIGLESQKARRSPGEIVQIDKHTMIVATGKDSLAIKELQIEGRRRMPAYEFIAGHNLKIGDKFTDKNL